LKKIERYARIAAHIAIQKSPLPVQALFKHTEEHQRRKMTALYARSKPEDGSKGTLLFWVPGGMPLLLHVEGAIAAAMKLRGYKVHAIICNAPYRGCSIRTVDDGVPVPEWRSVCASCTKQTKAVLDTLGIPYSYNGDYVTDEQRDELWERTAGVTLDNLKDLRYEGLELGSNVRSTIIRYLQGAALEGNEAIIREHAFSALVSAAAATKALETIKPWRVFMSHGVYVDWGPAMHAAMARGIPVTGWKASYLSWHFYLRHVTDVDRIDFKLLSKQAWADMRARKLTPKQNARLDKFFEDRYKKQISFDMKKIKEFRHDVDELRAEYRKPGRPLWAVLAHINWDSVSDYSPMAYPSFDEWMIDTVKTAIEIPEVDWLIKVHPIEAWDNPASGVQRLLEREFPNLPSHIRVIPAEEDVSPANLFEIIDGGVTVYGTAGLELALMGKPVILAGEAHYGGKGFTHEGLTPPAYRDLLRKASTLGSLDTSQREAVRQYAYSHFIRRQIPLEIVHHGDSVWWSLQHEKRDLLLPGRDPFIDFICEKLVSGDDFVMGEDLVALTEREVPEEVAEPQRAAVSEVSAA
jgi:hypothetical protein